MQKFDRLLPATCDPAYEAIGCYGTGELPRVMVDQISGTCHEWTRVSVRWTGVRIVRRKCALIVLTIF